MIFLGGWAIIGWLAWNGELSFGRFIAIVIGMAIAHVVYSRWRERRYPAPPAPEPKDFEISDKGLVLMRNLLLLHHNARQTEDGYRVSKVSRDTDAVISRLNGLLEKKIGPPA